MCKIWHQHPPLTKKKEKKKKRQQQQQQAHKGKTNVLQMAKVFIFTLQETL
jgi:hypothetical protein